MIVVPLQIEHFFFFQPQPLQKESWDMLITKDLSEVNFSLAWAVIASGRTIAIAGVQHQYGENLVWCYLADNIKEHFVSMTKKARRVLAAYPDNLVMYIDFDHKNGYRFAEALGFSPDRGNTLVANDRGALFCRYVRAR